MAIDREVQAEANNNVGNEYSGNKVHGGLLHNGNADNRAQGGMHNSPKESCFPKMSKRHCTVWGVVISLIVIIIVLLAVLIPLLVVRSQQNEILASMPPEQTPNGFPTVTLHP
ncbi:MAG: hypothetical protein M1820_004388 [Bogoriella megaspora]|nr:MAG: hypothetical protein M1820_004388 [Bogoriella megaspora]